MAEFATHMGDPQHTDPHGLGAFLKENHTRNPFRSACCGLVCRVAMWIAHVGGKFRHGLLEKLLILILEDAGRVLPCGGM